MQACADGWGATSRRWALSDPLFFPPGKGGERNTYTAFGRDASVGGLTQVRPCVGWGLLGPIGTQLFVEPRERGMWDPNFHTGGSLQVSRGWPGVGEDAMEAAVTVPPIHFSTTFYIFNFLKIYVLILERERGKGKERNIVPLFMHSWVNSHVP